MSLKLDLGPLKMEIEGCSIITSCIADGWVSVFFVILCDGK